MKKQKKKDKRHPPVMISNGRMQNDETKKKG